MPYFSTLKRFQIFFATFALLKEYEFIRGFLTRVCNLHKINEMIRKEL